MRSRTLLAAGIVMAVVAIAFTAFGLIAGDGR